MEITSAHFERVVVRVGDVYIKVETDPDRARRERIATTFAPVPTPSVLWWHDGPPSLLALARVTGASLAKLGEPSPHPAGAWVRAGAVARSLHRGPAPADLDRTPRPLRERIDDLRDWLLANTPAPLHVVELLASFAHDVLDPRDVEPVFTHGDLQAEHVIIDDTEVSAVIDWAEGGPGDPLRDLATLTQGHGEHLEDVLAGYGADVDRDVIRGYWAVGKLNGVRFMTSHGFDASDDLAALGMYAAALTGQES